MCLQELAGLFDSQPIPRVLKKKKGLKQVSMEDTPRVEKALPSDSDSNGSKL